MLDRFGYKCERLADVSPLIRISNSWPELPPEIPVLGEHYDWEALFPKLESMYYGGETMEAIMEALGIVSQDALHKRIQSYCRNGKLKERRYRTERYKWNAEKQETAERLLLEGKKVDEVAAVVGVCPATVKLKVKDAGLSFVFCGAVRGHWVRDLQSA